MTKREARICKAFLLAHNCKMRDYSNPLDDNREIGDYSNPLDDKIDLSVRQVEIFFDAMVDDGPENPKDRVGECAEKDCACCAEEKEDPWRVPIRGEDSTRSKSMAARAYRQAMKRSSDMGATFSLPLDKDVLIEEIATEIKLAVREARKEQSDR
jgi:hypothetical protein